MSNNDTGDMPELPIEQKSLEQRRVIKFWIDHCARLEAKNEELKRQISIYKESKTFGEEDSL